ncbi:MAG TPA: fibronectin type III domain-containing protein [Spirochaetota bacterium]|nr:fibronectin type III domain-containing protein [Spirochaetota bacterium]
MKRISFFIMVLAGVSCFSILLFFNEALNAETVFLKDGSIIEGRIISDSAGTVAVKDKDNKTRTVQRVNIMRILYTDLYMGKVYVQKTDGKNIIAYMVDEDRDTYTFRRELFNPEEFKLRRDQVLFMARGNPSGLEGEPDTDHVSLKWFPPYNQVRKYKIYIKGPGDKSYSVADETGSKSITLKKLKSNTKYQLYVTAIDSAGDESLPSNELSITTKNIPPSDPDVNPAEKLPGGDYKITWKESTDPDGKLAGYRVYKKLDGSETVISDTKKTEYTLSKNEEYDSIYIAAYDDLKGESDRSPVFLGRFPRIGVSIRAAYLYPMGKLKDLADYGYGAVVKYEMSNYFMQQLELSAELGFFYLQGGGDFTEPESKVNSLYLIPVMINGGYAFYPSETLAVIPYLSAGMMAVHYDYNYFNIPASKDTNVTENEYNPAAGAGITLRYIATEDVYIDISADYRIFFEESGSFSFCTGLIGAGMMF